MIEKINNILRMDDSDRAVSPVIGVILMVAITVILAAVIGTFVLGLGDDIEQDVQAGATVDQDAGNNQIVITWTSQGTADGIAVTGTGSDGDSATVVTTVGGSVILNNDGSASNAIDGSSSISEGDSLSVVAFQGDTSSINNLNDVNSNAERRTVIRTIEADFTISSP